MRQKASCHPLHRGRWAVQGIYCRDCLPREPVTRMADGPAPTACPHCHAAPPAWVIDDLEGRCVPCGQRWQRRVQAAYL